MNVYKTQDRGHIDGGCSNSAFRSGARVPSRIGQPERQRHRAGAARSGQSARRRVYRQQKEPKIVAFEREDKYQEAMEKWKADMQNVYQKAELILAKQRHGPTGKIDLFFEGEFTRFADLDTVHE